tara:strand:+ start:806 stop:1027 length:222 start_codon:yes stop_codon:yes gene_type:complete
MLVKGDLVRIPASSCLTQAHSDFHMIDRYTYLKKPTIAIFMKYQNEKALVFINNQYWSVDVKDIKITGCEHAC